MLRRCSFVSVKYDDTIYMHTMIVCLRRSSLRHRGIDNHIRRHVQVCNSARGVDHREAGPLLVARFEAGFDRGLVGRRHLGHLGVEVVETVVGVKAYRPTRTHRPVVDRCQPSLCVGLTQDVSPVCVYARVLCINQSINRRPQVEVDAVGVITSSRTC